MEARSRQDHLFSLTGPNEDGCVWISSTVALGWQHNVGPADQVAKILSKWLASFEPASAFQVTQDE